MRTYKIYTLSAIWILSAGAVHAVEYQTTSGFDPGMVPARERQLQSGRMVPRNNREHLSASTYVRHQRLAQPVAQEAGAAPLAPAETQQAMSRPAPLMQPQPVQPVAAPPPMQVAYVPETPVNPVVPAAQPQERTQPAIPPQPAASEILRPRNTAVPRYAYLGIRAGYSMLEDIEQTLPSSPGVTDRATISFDETGAFGLMAGVQPYSFLRVEGEASYFKHKVDAIHLTRAVSGTVIQSVADEDDQDLGFEAWSLMANSYLDMPLPFNDYFIPYVGGGVGWMFQRNGAEEDAFAYQAMAGLNVSLFNHKSRIGLGYRYLAAPDLFGRDDVDFDGESHQIELAWRQYF